jgi:uncharacterized protein YndB with AHSA1/START domain
MSVAETLKVEARGDVEIVISRRFNAPRKLVFEAMTTPTLIRRWLFGPPGWEMTVCEDDARVGGAFRWAWSGPDGAAMAMHGTYKEVVPGERIVRTETFDMGCDAHMGEQVGTMTLSERDGVTDLHLIVRYPSKEARDGAVASGMEHGMRASYDKLDEVLAESGA